MDYAPLFELLGSLLVGAILPPVIRFIHTFTNIESGKIKLITSYVFAFLLALVYGYLMKTTEGTAITATGLLTGSQMMYSLYLKEKMQ